jgi:hypothetical protein
MAVLKHIYCGAYGIVTVSKQINQKELGYKNINTIHNPIGIRSSFSL